MFFKRLKEELRALSGKKMAKLRALEARLERIEGREKQNAQRLKTLIDRHSVYVGDGVVLTKLHTGHMIYVTGQDVTVAASLIVHGRWEYWIEEIITSKVKPGMHVLDIGANHGYYSLIMGSLLNKSGKVYSFEANPSLANLLERSTALNSLSSVVEVHQKAAFSRSTEIELSFNPTYSGGGFVTEQKNFGTVTVPAVPVDDVVPDDVEISFVKIDVEGGEFDVLQGMKKILARSKNISMVIEFYQPAVARQMPPIDYLKDFEAQGFSLRLLWESGPTAPLTAEEVLRDTAPDVLSYLLLERGV